MRALKAARALRERAGLAEGAALTLTKKLPVASGIGGGSADAAAGNASMTAPSLQDRYAPNNKCFGCGPSNPKGLRIKSRVEGDTVVAEHDARWRAQIRAARKLLGTKPVSVFAKEKRNGTIFTGPGADRRCRRPPA